MERQPQYFYRSHEFATTFGNDANQGEPFEDFQEFKDGPLLECRGQMIKYISERLVGIDKVTYHLPFASTKDFIQRQQASYSITGSFIEYYSDDEEYEYPIISEDVETIKESLEIEKEVLSYIIGE